MGLTPDPSVEEERIRSICFRNLPHPQSPLRMERGQGTFVL
jgi:hypothetical protein